jgi:hypothetical protein
MKYQLGQITTANGYRSNVRAVYDPIVNMEKIVSYPVIDIEWGDEVRSNQSDGDRLAGNRSMYDITLPCTAHCYLKAVDIQDAQDNLLADVQELIGNNFYLTGSDGNRTAFVVTYEGASIGGIEAQSSSQPNGFISINLNCHYRILYSDPTVMG